MVNWKPKKSAARKATTISPLEMDAAERAREFGLDYSDAHLMLGNKELRFDSESGEWYEDSESAVRQSKKSRAGAAGLSAKDLEQLKRTEKALSEENNLLRVKNDLLLDMISEVYSEMKLEAVAEPRR